MDTNRSPAPNLSSSGRQPMLTELTRYAFERESEADELNERLVIVIENARALAGDQLCQHAQEQLDPYRDLKAERDDFLYQANRFRLAIAISLAGSGAFEQAIDMLSFVASNLDIVSGIKVRQIRKNIRRTAVALVASMAAASAAH